MLRGRYDTVCLGRSCLQCALNLTCQGRNLCYAPLKLGNRNLIGKYAGFLRSVAPQGKLAFCKQRSHVVNALLIRICDVFRNKSLSKFNNILIAAEVIFSVYIVIIVNTGNLSGHFQKTLKGRCGCKSDTIIVACSLFGNILSHINVIF